MLSFAIIVFLAYFFYAGAERGLWLQLVHVGGYLVSLGLAALLYQPVAKLLSLWVPYPSATQSSHFVFFSNRVGLTLDDAFYRGIAFLLVLAVGWLLTRFGALWVHDLKYRKADRASFITGGLLNLVMGYVFLFLVLYVVALIPLAGLQNMLANSFLARTIVRYSLGLTNWVTALWL
ncbi:CvpA family protein [Lacticaseibacillus camelliae]|uniref:Membrane ancor connecting MutS2 with cell-division Z-ring n=1 Tax=Lacticaseibacillus camelliae DSM 22697 = JCM 13995 TaxID=1423730 RepID=A0A0R2F6J3_9LACO|nr:CvpA family protein [Lacticaseibacillus camelliae]KRN23051.1 membrane ancor connecting MutS2 with cell-division Z-ring [Lacticaseibacillus camelliae DSM 22697 = JCM 13995]